VDARKLERIRRLIAIASREVKTEEEERERAIAQSQAEALMLKYSIEEWQVSQAGGRGAAALKPEVKDGIFICAIGHPCQMSLANLAVSLGRHLNVAVHFSGLGLTGKHPGWDVTATAIGYPEDLSMWEMIFTMLHLQLISKIEPKVDISKSFDENVYIMHAAGVKWQEIARRINLAEVPAEWRVNWTANGDGGRLKRASRRWAAANGLEYVVKASPAAYQRSFTESYVYTVLRRFREARANDKTSGAELVLRDKFAAVQSAQAELFPNLAPVADKSKMKPNSDGWLSGALAGEQADLNLSPRSSSSNKTALS
jgi:hypothetical protein